MEGGEKGRGTFSVVVLVELRCQRRGGERGAGDIDGHIGES